MTPLHPPRIDVPPAVALADLTIADLRREAQTLLELSSRANAMGDLMGAATTIGRGFRVDRELRLRFARLAEDGWGRCTDCGEWVRESEITTGGGHAVGGAPPDHCGPVETSESDREAGRC